VVQGPVSNRRYSRRAVRSAILTAVGVVVTIIIATGAWYVINGMRESARQETRQQLEAHTRDLAAGVAATVETIAGQLNQLASMTPKSWPRMAKCWERVSNQP